MDNHPTIDPTKVTAWKKVTKAEVEQRYGSLAQFQGKFKIVEWVPGEPLPPFFYAYWSQDGEWRVTDSPVRSVLLGRPFELSCGSLWIPGEPLPEIGGWFEWKQQTLTLTWRFDEVELNVVFEGQLNVYVKPPEPKPLRLTRYVYKPYL